MDETWEKHLDCASICQRCRKPLGKKDPRILSVVDHQPICLDCKQSEEAQPEYSDQSKQMIAGCIAATGKPYGDTASYCFHHFLPFTCKE
jgi:hypothetical protein